MPRSIDPTTSTSLTQPIVPIAIMVDIQIAAGPIYAWSGYGDLIYNGITYLGIGKLGKISLVQETNSVYASGAQITLEGIDSTDLTEALSDITIGQPVSIYFAVLNAAGQIAGTPITIFAGLTDQVSISESIDNCSITIDVESKLAQLQRNREYRYTDQMQRFLHPGDGAFRYVNLLTNYVGSWGYKGNGL